jgi:hypothetical protein
MTSTNNFVNRYELNQRFEDKFLRINTFYRSDTDNIFNLNFKLYFDNYGNVSVQAPSGNILVEYLNPTTPGKPMVYSIPTNLVSMENRKDKFDKPYDVIFSPNLQWMLYKVVYTAEDVKKLPEDVVISAGTYTYLLFNFFHTEDFKTYYKSNSTNAMNLFNDYCVKTKDLDPTCSCLPVNKELCVRRLLPESLVNSQKGTSTYNAFATICQHVEQGCQTITSYPTSFLNQYYIDFPRPASVNVTLCAQSFTAGGNISIKKGDIQQQCSSGGMESIGAVLVTPAKPPAPDGGSEEGGTGGTGETTTNQGFLDKYLKYSEYSTAYNIAGGLVIAGVVGGVAWKLWKTRRSPTPAPTPAPTS